MSKENSLDFIPRVSVLPFEWRSLGAVFGLGASTTQALSGRCNFLVRPGVDPTAQVTTGTVTEGLGDAGISLKHESLAFTLSAGNLSFRTGLDDPLVSQAVGASSVPSLKATVARDFGEGQYVAISYDLKQKRPEVSFCWTGETYTDKATLLVNLDPLMRTANLGAALSFPGPEWKVSVYNENTLLVEEPEDDGARHKLYVQHQIKSRHWLHRTRIGCRLDLGRIANYAADYIDYNIKENIPSYFWNLPLSQRIYNLVVPAEDEDQVRFAMKGWEVDVSHDFAKSRPTVALSKSFKQMAVAASYNFADKEYGVEVSRSGITAAARLGRLHGQGWKKPSLQLLVEPLSLLQ